MRAVAPRGPDQRRVDDAGELSLESWEATLLANLNGETPVQRVIADTKRPEGAVRATLAALLSLHALEKAL